MVRRSKEIRRPEKEELLENGVFAVLKYHLTLALFVFCLFVSLIIKGKWTFIMERSCNDSLN